MRINVNQHYYLWFLTEIAPQGFKKAWVIKSFGDTINYDTIAKVPQKMNNAVVAIKSLIWPGLTIAVFVRKIFFFFSTCQENTYQSIYVGHGFKADIKPFYPTFTKNVREDPEDPEEQPEVIFFNYKNLIFLSQTQLIFLHNKNRKMLKKENKVKRMKKDKQKTKRVKLIYRINILMKL